MQEKDYERIALTRESAASWIKRQAGWLILILSSIAFVFKESFQFEKKDLDILSLAMSIGLTYFFTFYSAISMYIMGKNQGKESQSFINSLVYLANAKKDVKDILYLLPKFIQYKNTQATENARQRIIENAGLVYSFYKKEYYKRDNVVKNLTKEQLKALDKVNKIKITKLQPNDLLGEHQKTKGYDPLYLGKDETTDMKQRSISLLFNKATFPIVTGMLAVNVVLGQNLLYGLYQVSIIMIMAYKQYEGGKAFVITNLKGRQIDKADYLIEFKNLFDNHSPIFNDEIDLMDAIKMEIDEKKETV